MAIDGAVSKLTICHPGLDPRSHTTLTFSVYNEIADHVRHDKT